MPNKQLIDTHCHLDFEAFDEDRDEVIRRALDRNIQNIIIPGTQKKFWSRIKQLCDRYQQLHACYGLHPYWANEHEKQDIKQLITFIESNRPVAIGECGLDFRPQHADKETQLYFFEAQLEIALNHQLPVVIHSVKATETVIQTIKKFKNLNGMVHSYSGSGEQAKQLIDLGFYISVASSITYDNTKKIRQVVKGIPLTSLLLETDAPDQPDLKHFNKRNEPAYLVNTLQAIAKLKEDTIDSIAEQTTINAKKLFKL